MTTILALFTLKNRVSSSFLVNSCLDIINVLPALMISNFNVFDTRTPTEMLKMILNTQKLYFFTGVYL